MDAGARRWSVISHGNRQLDFRLGVRDDNLVFLRGTLDPTEGPVQTVAFEIEGGVIRALCVVRNPDELRHLAPARVEGSAEWMSIGSFEARQCTARALCMRVLLT